jgi:hypothetical protein
MQKTLISALVLVAACASPSRSEMQERDAEVRRLTSARAVHMPKGVESCVGVTLRMIDPSAPAETVAERDAMTKLLTEAEIKASTSAAEACANGFLEAVRAGQTSAEPIQLAMSYGIDPDGRVCAVVEKERQEPIDPSAAPLLDQSAECLKEALFASQFPAGRVKEKERIVLQYRLSLEPTE